MSINGGQDAEQAMSSPKREAWFHFIKRPRLIFWLAVSITGLVTSLVPMAFPGELLLSSGVLGAGIAGLMSEFTFCYDRREADFDLQVQKQRYANLEAQVGQIDAVTRKTNIVSINQMFQLGVNLYQLRFLDGDLAALFRAETEDLGEILRLTGAIHSFLSNPYLRPEHGLPSEGQDPFPGMRSAVQLRYAEEARAALITGSMVSTVMHTPQGFIANKDYRIKVAAILKETISHLYLLPAVARNMLGAIKDVEDDTCDPAAFIGYLTLFMLYLVHRTTGDNAIVTPLFESPVSLAESSTAAEIKRIWALTGGQRAEDPKLRNPEIAVTEVEPSEGGAYRAARRERESSKNRIERHIKHTIRRWNGALRLVSVWSLVFWLVVTAAGFVMALIPHAFSAKDLLSSGLIGAGIAGILSEFTFCFDRSDARAELRDQRQRYDELKHHIETVERLMKRSDLVQINQIFKLGRALNSIRLVDEDQMQDFRIQAEELADFLGLSAAVGKFLKHPYLRPSEIPRPGQDPFIDLIPAVARRYAQEGMEALKAGSIFSAVISVPGYWDGGTNRNTVTAILKKAINYLYLEPIVLKNMSDAIRELERGACKPSDFLLYFTLFTIYLDYRVTGGYAEVAPLFELPTSLSDAPTAAKVYDLLIQINRKATEGVRAADAS